MGGSHSLWYDCRTGTHRRQQTSRTAAASTSLSTRTQPRPPLRPLRMARARREIKMCEGLVLRGPWDVWAGGSQPPDGHQCSATKRHPRPCTRTGCQHPPPPGAPPFPQHSRLAAAALPTHRRVWIDVTARRSSGSRIAGGDRKAGCVICRTKEGPATAVA